MEEKDIASQKCGNGKLSKYFCWICTSFPLITCSIGFQFYIRSSWTYIVDYINSVCQYVGVSNTINLLPVDFQERYNDLREGIIFCLALVVILLGFNDFECAKESSDFCMLGMPSLLSCNRTLE